MHIKKALFSTCATDINHTRAFEGMTIQTTFWGRRKITAPGYQSSISLWSLFEFTLQLNTPRYNNGCGYNYTKFADAVIELGFQSEQQQKNLNWFSYCLLVLHEPWVTIYPGIRNTLCWELSLE